jgi:two-component system, OmpR family, response regulator RegX3
MSTINDGHNDVGTPRSAAAPSVLVVDDDRTMVYLLTYILENDGYQAAAAFTIQDALEQLQHRTFSLLMLDVGLPDGSGIDLCRTVRTTSDVPIMMITAEQGEANLVEALEGGADDYVTKPFNARALLARIGAILRRRARDVPSTVPPPVEVPAHTGHISLDRGQRTASVNSQEVLLTPTEFRLLDLLLANNGATIPASEIVQHIWGFTGAGDETLVRMHVTRLRNKLEAHCGHRGHIVNRRAIGYRFISSPES